MNELWRLGLVQTDPHFGNYRVRLDPAGKTDRLILLDFGASREVTGPYLQGYRQLVLGAVEQDPAGIVAGATELGFLMPDDSQERQQLFIRLCTLICEPFARPGTPEIRADLFDEAGNYDWGRSDLPKRVAKLGAQILFNLSCARRRARRSFWTASWAGSSSFWPPCGSSCGRGTSCATTYRCRTPAAERRVGGAGDGRGRVQPTAADG